jgi:hypothetical protein
MLPSEPGLSVDQGLCLASQHLVVSLLSCYSGDPTIRSTAHFHHCTHTWPLIRGCRGNPDFSSFSLGIQHYSFLWAQIVVL